VCLFTRLLATVRTEVVSASVVRASENALQADARIAFCKNRFAAAAETKDEKIRTTARLCQGMQLTSKVFASRQASPTTLTGKIESCVVPSEQVF
jgi:hypothetical protein